MSILRELRFAVRGLVKSPVLAGVAVVTLGLGIGMTALMFSLVYGAIFRGLPFPEEERIIRVAWAQPSAPGAWAELSLHDYARLKAEQRSLTDLAAVYTGTANVAGNGRPVRYAGGFITPNAFASLQVRPALGRTFREEEGIPGAPLAVILGHHVWVNDFGTDPNVLGRALRVNGEPATVVGVMPPGFRFPDTEDVWVPHRVDPQQVPLGTGPGLEVYGRLAPGVDRQQASAELAGIARRLAAERPERSNFSAFRVEKFSKPPSDMTTAFLLMLAAVVLVLLVACTNVANLLLARAAGRTHEFAVSLAIGAGRGRLVSKLLAEALILVVLGAALGVALGWLGLRLVLALAVTSPPPFWFVFTIDGPALLFVTGAGALAALVAGVVPGLQMSRTPVNAILKDHGPGASSRRTGRLIRGLVVAELALSVGLLVPSGLFVKGMIRLRSLDHGIFQEQVLTARVGLFESEFPTIEATRQFFGELQRRLLSRPEITSASLASALPGLGSPRTQVGIRGVEYREGQAYPQVGVAYVSPGFFGTFDADFLFGRDFAPSDDASAEPVAIVNQSFARRFFPDGEVIGRQIRQGASQSREPWRTIVGVVPDLYLEGLTSRSQYHPSGFYVPVAQSAARFVSIAVRGRERQDVLASALRDEVASLHADTPIFRVRSMARAFREELWFVDLFGGIFAVFGGLALLLAAAGLYAVMATGVAQRGREIGVRMALGARTGSLLSMVLRQAVVQIALGLTIGLGLAAACVRGLGSMLFGVEPSDVSVFAAIALVMLASGLAACVIPARRAASVNPVTVLRVG